MHVISGDGWMWLLCWLQVGVETVNCVSASEIATQQLNRIVSHHPFEHKIRMGGLKERGGDKITIICTHLTSSDFLDYYLDRSAHIVNGIRIVSVPPIISLQNVVKLRLGSNYQWITLRHSAMGGLTSLDYRRELL